MTRTSLAPVLSATLHRVSCWITAPSLRPFHDLDDPPPLGLRQGTGLHHSDGVAHVRLVRFIVRRKPGRAPNDLLVERMADLTVDLDQHGLVHRVGHHHAGADLPPSAFVRLSHFRSLPSCSYACASFASPPAVPRARRRPPRPQLRARASRRGARPSSSLRPGPGGTGPGPRHRPGPAPPRPPAPAGVRAARSGSSKRRAVHP